MQSAPAAGGAGDPVKPRPYRGAFLVAADTAPCRQQRLLQQILGVLYRAEDAIAVQLELVSVRLDEPAERLTIAAPRQRQQIPGRRALLHGRSFSPAGP